MDGLTTSGNRRNIVVPCILRRCPSHFGDVSITNVALHAWAATPSASDSPTQRVKHESVNGWCLTCRRAKCQAPPNPADAMPLPRLPPARTPREQQERIDRARAAQPIVQANLRGRLQALRARKNLPEDQLPMAAPLHGLN